VEAPVHNFVAPILRYLPVGLRRNMDCIRQLPVLWTERIPVELWWHVQIETSCNL